MQWEVLSVAHQLRLVLTKHRGQRRARYPGTQQGRHHRQRLYAADRRERQTDAGRDLSGACSVAVAQDFVKFRTISHGRRLRMSPNDRIKSVGRLTQR